MASEARELLEIAVEYVEARKTTEWATAYGTTPPVELDEIAGRWQSALDGYLAARQR